MRLRFALLCCMLTIAGVADAQTTMRVRGTITGLEGDVLSVKSRTGQDLKITLTEKTGVAYVKALTLADIKPGDGLGTTAVERPDGTLVAREIHTFPPALGVPNEGHRPWEGGQSMTNARVSAVSAMVQGANGRELTLAWKDGAKKLFVPDGIPIVTTVDADRSFLKPGEYVYINTVETAADGTLRALGRIQVSKDGVKPPQ